MSEDMWMLILPKPRLMFCKRAVTGSDSLQTDCGRTVHRCGLLVDYNITPVPVLARLHGEILGDKKLAEYNRLNQQLVTLEQQKIEVKEEFAMAVAERGGRKPGCWHAAIHNCRAK